MRIGWWFDTRGCVRGGSTIEACATVLLYTVANYVTISFPPVGSEADL
jgi:hypothetical protein